MERKFKFSIGEFYHIYNRGNNKINIFIDNSDRDRFVSLLFLCNSSVSVVFKNVQGRSLDTIDVGNKITHIGAYCLMPNHFHILVRETEDGGITKFLSKLSTGYSMFFNKKYERTGSLFEGRFKATHIDSDQYLKYLFSYIHLNPVKLIDPLWKEFGVQDRNRTKKYLSKYVYSSYLDYQGVRREEGVVLDSGQFPEYFNKPTEFDLFIDEWLEFIKIQGPPL